jgi:hypothetical protein
MYRKVESHHLKERGHLGDIALRTEDNIKNISDGTWLEVGYIAGQL